MKILEMKSLVVLVVMGCLSCSVSAVDILYDFETSSRTNIVDVMPTDGSQNGQVNQPSGWGVGDGPTIGETDGIGGSGGLDFVDIQRPFGLSNLLETQAIIDFTTSMSFSVDIKPTVLPAAGTTTTLLWTGRQRGTGETGFTINEFGQLSLYMAGLNPGVAHVSTGSNLIQLDQYQTVGFALGVDPGNDVNVEGRTLRFYIDGVVIDTFTGVGIGQATLPNLARATGSPVQVGWAQNIGASYQTQYTGYMDNVFASDRHLTGDEMLALHETGLPYVTQDCGDLGTEYLDADLNDDCYVNLADVAMFASQWMLCNNPPDVACAEQ